MTEIISRSDAVMLRQAIRRKWAIPDAVFETLPEKAHRLTESDNDRAVAAGIKLLLEMHKQNEAPDPSAQPAPQAAPTLNLQINNGVTSLGNPDSGGGAAAAIVARIRAGSLPGPTS